MNFVAWFLLVVFVVLFCCKICGCWKDNIYAAEDEYVFFRQCQVACFAFVNVWQLVKQQCIVQYKFLPVPGALRANCTLDIFIQKPVRWFWYACNQLFTFLSFEHCENLNCSHIVLYIWKCVYSLYDIFEELESTNGFR